MQIAVMLFTGKHFIIADIFLLSVHYQYGNKNGVTLQHCAWRVNEISS